MKKPKKRTHQSEKQYNIQNEVERISLQEVQQLFQEIGYYLDGKDIHHVQRMYTLCESDTLHFDVRHAIQQIFLESLQRGYSVKNQSDYEVLSMISYIVTQKILPTFEEVCEKLQISQMSFVYSDPLYQRFDVYAEQWILQKIRNTSVSNTKRSYITSLYLHGNIWKANEEHIEGTLRNEITKTGIQVLDGKYDMERDNNLIDISKILLQLIDIEHEILTEKWRHFWWKNITPLQEQFQTIRENVPLSLSNEYLLQLQEINYQISQYFSHEWGKGEIE